MLVSWNVKKLLVIIVLGFLFSGNSNASSLYGTGKIEIEKYIYDYIYKYLGDSTVRNKNKGAAKRGTPGGLAISLTGKDAGASYCPFGRRCVSTDIVQVKRHCEVNAKKNKRPSKCKVVFYNRTLKWGGVKNKLTQEDDIEAELAAVGITVKGSSLSSSSSNISSNNNKTTRGEVTYINTTTGDFFTVKKEVPYQYGKPRSSVPLSMQTEAKEKCLKNSRDNKCEVYILRHPNGKTKYFNPKTTYNKSLDKKPVIKKPKQSAKIYSLNETRSIALKWDGYADLIAGTIEINEKDYKGEINLTLPNKDGSCNGSYSLQKDGRGTWQISCTNNMGAAGSLEWVRDGGTTGKGRDYKDKKVQFTVANK